MGVKPREHSAGHSNSLTNRRCVLGAEEMSHPHQMQWEMRMDLDLKNLTDLFKTMGNVNAGGYKRY